MPEQRRSHFLDLEEENLLRIVCTEQNFQSSL